MKNKIIKEIKDRVKQGLNIHDLDLIDCISITNSLLNSGIINYWIEELSEDNDDFVYLCYYSKKLQKTIVFDDDFYQDNDGETIELMAESIWQMELDIQEFEKKILFNEDFDVLEKRLASNIELLKNLKRDVLFNNQIDRDLSEDERKISFNDVLEDLEDIRNELDIITLTD